MDWFKRFGGCITNNGCIVFQLLSLRFVKQDNCRDEDRLDDVADTHARSKPRYSS